MVLFLILILAWDDCRQEQGGELITNQPVSYRLLAMDKSPPQSHLKIINYRISVDRRLEKGDFEELICEVIKREKPEDYELLRIYFYYKLDSFFADITSNPKNRTAYRHALGAYDWSRYLSEYRVVRIFQDKHGRDILDGRQDFKFDHASDCDKRRK